MEIVDIKQLDSPNLRNDKLIIKLKTINQYSLSVNQLYDYRPQNRDQRPTKTINKILQTGFN